MKLQFNKVSVGPETWKLPVSLEVLNKGSRGFLDPSRLLVNPPWAPGTLSKRITVLLLEGPYPGAEG